MKESNLISNYDLCVIGGGSGGFGAALAASRSGLKVALIEQQSSLGGNAALNGVSIWEPGIGGTDIPFEIYKRLQKIPNAVGIYTVDHSCCWPGTQWNTPPFPGGSARIDPSFGYESTLKRYGTLGLRKERPEKIIEQWHGVVFEPIEYSEVLLQMLQETGNCDIFLNTSFVNIYTEGSHIEAISITTPDGEERLNANYFIDSTASVALSRAYGADTMFGPEPYSQFHESGAPETIEGPIINGVSLIYRVTPQTDSTSEESDKNTEEHPVFASCVQYPNGDININMLPTMEGNTFYEYVQSDKQNGYKRAYQECESRVRRHWNWLKNNHSHYFGGYTIQSISKTLGIREGHRIVGEHVLTQNDVLAGIDTQEHNDLIALCDHGIDVHHKDSTGCIEMKQPYGVPYRCLIPKGADNLLVACRGASFSQIAASSCRTSRTMMSLGHAAGLAISLAHPKQCSVQDIDVAQLQDLLRAQGAPLPQQARTLSP